MVECSRMDVFDILSLGVMMSSKKKRNIAEMLEDVFLLVDVFLSVVAVCLEKAGKADLSKIMFGISGAAVMVMLVCMITKRLQRRNDT